jgi:hypothetical protein
MIGGVILRRWRGSVRAEDAARYLEHQDETGVGDYRETAGNLGVFVLSRRRGGMVEIETLSLWTSMDAVRAFAGDDPDVARFYPGDDDLLVDKDAHADHFEVESFSLEQGVVERGG